MGRRIVPKIYRPMMDCPIITPPYMHGLEKKKRNKNVSSFSKSKSKGTNPKK
jgi:hypothetical protein